MPMLSNPRSTAPSPVSTTSDNLIPRTFSYGLLRTQPGNSVRAQFRAVPCEAWPGLISECDDCPAAPIIEMGGARKRLGKSLHPKDRQIDAPKLCLEISPFCNDDLVR